MVAGFDIGDKIAVERPTKDFERDIGSVDEVKLFETLIGLQFYSRFLRICRVIAGIKMLLISGPQHPQAVSSPRGKSWR
jgi:hypothetical protein